MNFKVGSLVRMTLNRYIRLRPDHVKEFNISPRKLYVVVKLGNDTNTLMHNEVLLNSLLDTDITFNSINHGTGYCMLKSDLILEEE